MHSYLVISHTATCVSSGAKTGKYIQHRGQRLGGFLDGVNSCSSVEIPVSFASHGQLLTGDC